MRTIHQSRTVFSAFAAVLTFALCAPIGVNAEDQPLAAAPAVPSWDETSGYGAVEASRAAIGHPAPVADELWVAISDPSTVTSHRRGTALYAVSVPSPSWDETSGYGSVEASRAAASALRTRVAAPSPCADSIPAALASGRRAESAHLATVSLTGEGAVDGALANC